MTQKDTNERRGDLIGGEYLVRFQARTLDDIRALGCNSEEDERKFAAAARVSDINLGLYRTFVQPWVRTWANEGFAEWFRRVHPLRLQYEMFSHVNPFMRPLLSAVGYVQETRQPVSKDNIFWQAQEWFADWIETSLDAYRDVRDHSSEALFHAVYGSPVLQALVGLKASDASPRRRVGRDAAHHALVAQRIDELKKAIPEGGAREAVLRALVYIRMPGGMGVVDERGFNLLRRMREDAGEGLTLAQFKQVLRDQFLMVLLDERRAVEAIPAMLAREPEIAPRQISKLRRMIDVVELRSDVEKARWAEVQKLIEVARYSSVNSGFQEKNDSEPGRAVRVRAART